ncbi:MAG: hypothetical protein HY000_34450 [Planctomycetes bacterium]|nr:hypothetical protein [Planctomycetota bacterium]
MRFPYLALPTRQPIYPLAGARVRHRPIVPVRIIGPLGSRLRDGSLDSGSDDTLLPRHLARRLGIDMQGAPQGEAKPIGGPSIPYHYATVTLLVTDGRETCQWEATVGFIDAPLRWAVLGHAGFLQFFDTELHGARREAILNPNASFPGHHAAHATVSP